MSNIPQIDFDSLGRAPCLRKIVEIPTGHARHKSSGGKS